MSVSESLSASSSLVAVVLSVASVADGASVTSGACARPAASPSVHGACGCRPPGRRTAFALNTDALVPYVANLTSICRGFPPGRPSRFTRSISLGSTGIRNFLLHRSRTFAHTSSLFPSGSPEIRREVRRVYCSSRSWSCWTSKVAPLKFGNG